jgi:hypothetical protein
MNTPTLCTNYIHRSLARSALLFVSLVIGCFALLPGAQGLSPEPDGGYPRANTAEGEKALLNLTTGSFNTAVGYFSLGTTATSIFNTANGAYALRENTTGGKNTATGVSALNSNTTGRSNTGNGILALENNTTGSFNIALGVNAGVNVTTANNVICIGANGNNVDNSCYIGQIFGATTSGGTTVFVNSDGRLGATVSSRRFKEEIKPMEQTSEALLALKPVTFRYKKEIDPAGISQFGLVAEEVEKVNPDLVVRDKEGKPYSVRYDQLNAMLLNEFLKAHQKLEEQGATIAKQQKQIEALTAGLQKVSEQMELSKPVRPMVMNNQ